MTAVYYRADIEFPSVKIPLALWELYFYFGWYSLFVVALMDSRLIKLNMYLSINKSRIPELEGMTTLFANN
ncbi:MAG TPA: hypothetical protein V6D15_09460 [Oculatellaceae cyanobacterium]|jgi:hypothetical protein